MFAESPLLHLHPIPPHLPLSGCLAPKNQLCPERPKKKKKIMKGWEFATWTGQSARDCRAPAYRRHLTCSRLSRSTRKPESRGTSRTAILEDPACSHLPMRGETGPGAQAPRWNSQSPLTLIIPTAEVLGSTPWAWPCGPSVQTQLAGRPVSPFHTRDPKTVRRGLCGGL